MTCIECEGGILKCHFHDRLEMCRAHCDIDTSIASQECNKIDLTLSFVVYMLITCRLMLSLFVYICFFSHLRKFLFFGQVVRSFFHFLRTNATVTVVIAIVVCFSLSLFHRLFNEEENPLMLFNMLVAIIFIKIRKLYG